MVLCIESMRGCELFNDHIPAIRNILKDWCGATEDDEVSIYAYIYICVYKTLTRIFPAALHYGG